MRRVRLFCWIPCIVALWFTNARVQAFSLLGPYAPWMDEAKGYRQLDDIGGPMNINEGYRWNVPTLTYAFDQSFVDYFGSNGVAQVEDAFRILNDLPAASRLVLSNFPLTSSRLNFAAWQESLLDLKSAALSLVVEHLGLAQPVRDVFAIRRWNPFLFGTTELDWYPWIPDYIIERNFDPFSLGPTHFVNEILYTGQMEAYTPAGPAWILAFPVDPLAGGSPGVADQIFSKTWLSSGLGPAGLYFPGLTRDDAGGLRYLLSKTNMNFEMLLPDVHGVGGTGGQSNYVNGARRPGIEKLTFVRQSYNSATGQASPLTYRFKDTYLTNGVAKHQELERVVTRPDFLFTAADLGDGNFTWYTSTSTSQWSNNAALNGAPTGAGPGVIQPPVTITFHKLGQTVSTWDASVATGEAYTDPSRWGEFGAATNHPPVAFPPVTAPGADQVTLRFRLISQATGEIVGTHTWQFPLAVGAWANLQVSSNLTQWVTVATPTNCGGVIAWSHVVNSRPECFFRVVPPGSGFRPNAHAQTR